MTLDPRHPRGGLLAVQRAQQILIGDMGFFHDPKPVVMH
jgi:hypothetical protein